MPGKYRVSAIFLINDGNLGVVVVPEIILPRAVYLSLLHSSSVMIVVTPCHKLVMELEKMVEKTYLIRQGVSKIREWPYF